MACVGESLHSRQAAASQPVACSGLHYSMKTEVFQTLAPRHSKLARHITGELARGCQPALHAPAACIWQIFQALSMPLCGLCQRVEAC